MSLELAAGKDPVADGARSFVGSLQVIREEGVGEEGEGVGRGVNAHIMYIGH